MTLSKFTHYKINASAEITLSDLDTNNIAYYSSAREKDSAVNLNEFESLKLSCSLAASR